MSLPRPASARELAVLRNPDRRSAWAIAMSARLAVAEPGDRDLDQLAQSDPIVAARWSAGRWIAGTPGAITHSALAGLLEPFDLSSEPPLRVALDPAGGVLHLAGHHAAFDGLALAAVTARLVGGNLPPPAQAAAQPAATPPPPSPTALARLARPAARVAPSNPQPSTESLARRDLVVAGPGVTAQLAAAAAHAVAARNAAHGAALRRIGVSIGVGGSTAIGNTASYRRVDVDRPDEVFAAVQAALASSAEPMVLRRPSRLLRLLAPIAGRFSDTFLVSNLGRLDIPGVSRLEFYPVARGRSAVAFGAAGLSGGPSTLTVRARDLNQADAEQLLDDVVRRLSDR